MRERPTRVRRLRIRKAIGNATLAVAVLTVGSLYLALEKHVTLVVNGRPQAVRTLTGNVGELLDTRGIVLDGQDHVAPPPATPLADGMTVVVETGSPVLQGFQGGGVWVVDGVQGSSAKLAVEHTESWFSAGEPVGPSRIVDARVVVKGKEHDVLTNATTVRELLSAMGIEPDGNDRVLPPPRTPLRGGALVRYVDVDFKTQQVVSTFPYQTVTTYASDIPAGSVRIARPGRSGRMVVMYLVKVVDGKVVNRTEVSRQVIEPAVPAERVMGRPSVHGSQSGVASWYDPPWSGFTAAHPWLPFGTVVTVTNLDTGKSVQVVIDDRGPFLGSRIIDLSPEAFSALAPLGLGVLNVRLTW